MGTSQNHLITQHSEWRTNGHLTTFLCWYPLWNNVMWRKLGWDWTRSIKWATNPPLWYIGIPFSRILRTAAGTNWRVGQGRPGRMLVPIRCWQGKDDCASLRKWNCASSLPWCFETLTEDGWDTFGMIAVNVAGPCHDRDYLMDNDKCLHFYIGNRHHK